jgi:ABC-type spermidine/putrescine transport system permease subunit I
MRTHGAACSCGRAWAPAVSVVVRTLGWALLFGSTGLINKALQTRG